MRLLRLLSMCLLLIWGGPRLLVAAGSDWKFISRGFQQEVFQVRLTLSRHVVFALRSHAPMLPPHSRLLLSWPGLNREVPILRFHICQTKKKEWGIGVLEGVHEKDLSVLMDSWKKMGQGRKVEKVKGLSVQIGKVGRADIAWVYMGEEVFFGKRRDLKRALKSGAMLSPKSREWALSGLPKREGKTTDFLRVQVLADFSFGILSESERKSLEKALRIFGVPELDAFRGVLDVELQKGRGLVAKAFLPLEDGEGLVGRVLTPKAQEVGKVFWHPGQEAITHSRLPLMDFWSLWRKLQYEWKPQYGKEYDEDLKEASESMGFDLEGLFLFHLEEVQEWGRVDLDGEKRSYLRVPLKKPLHRDELMAFLSWLGYNVTWSQVGKEEEEFMLSSVKGKKLARFWKNPSSLWFFYGEPTTPELEPSEFRLRAVFPEKEKSGHRWRLTAPTIKSELAGLLKKAGVPEAFHLVVLQGLGDFDGVLSHSLGGLKLNTTLFYPNWKETLGLFIPGLNNTP